MLTFDPTTEKRPTKSRRMISWRNSRSSPQLDQEWRDHFAATNIPMRQSAEDEEKRQFMFDSIVAATSLQEILLEQVRESKLDTEEQRHCANCSSATLTTTAISKPAWRNFHTPPTSPVAEN